MRAAAAPSGLRELAVCGHTAVVLDTEAEVREEWTAMRNCALRYAARCAEGVHRLVSLRDRETGERVLTIVVKRERGRYVVLDARRRFDRPADAAQWSIAERVATVLGSALAAARRADRRRTAACAHLRRSGGAVSGAQAAFDFELA